MISVEYFPVLILALIGFVFALAFTSLAFIFGPKDKNPIKQMPFEAGMPSTGKTGKKFEVKFYMTALIFLIFDVEIMFLYPWAVKLLDLGWFGFIEVMIFFMVLTLALMYVWKKGALEWE